MPLEPRTGLKTIWVFAADLPWLQVLRPAIYPPGYIFSPCEVHRLFVPEDFPEPAVWRRYCRRYAKCCQPSTGGAKT